LIPEVVWNAGKKSNPSMIWLKYTVQQEFSSFHHRLHDVLVSGSSQEQRISDPVPHTTLARLKSGVLPAAGTWHETGLPEFLEVKEAQLWQTTHDEKGVLYQCLRKFPFGT
jgi:2'-5' RNA ligase